MLDLASILFVATFRDWVIIVTGIIIGAFFFTLLLVALVLGLVLRSILSKASSMMDENVKPLLGSAKETADHVKGTTRFVSRSAVTPIIRTAGVVAGVRRAAGVIAGLTGAGGEPPKH